MVKYIKNWLVLSFIFFIAFQCQNKNTDQKKSTGFHPSLPAGSELVTVQNGTLELISLNSLPVNPNLIQATGSVSGAVYYDFVPVVGNSVAFTSYLNYSGKILKPVRRARVILFNQNDQLLSETLTNDSGSFLFNNITGNNLYIIVLAASQSSLYASDMISPDFCNGASWDISVRDNIFTNSVYSIKYYGVEVNQSITINIPLNGADDTIIGRISAPFAILDTALSEVELICQGNSALVYPRVEIRWSTYNSPSTNYDPLTGQIVTSHYMKTNGTPVVYLLGHKNVDIDEFDSHVVAHEFAHYMEDNLFRKDSIGGMHQLDDSLFSTVAFSEGYSNAIAAMVLNDPVYKDTSGVNEASGFSLPIQIIFSNSNLYSNYSELSTQYLLWHLYENRDAVLNSGLFDKIYNILTQFKNISALTTLQTFAALYKEANGGFSENFSVLWGDIRNDYNSLCTGTCNNVSDIKDLYDSDNDNGIFYANSANPLHYPPLSGTQKTSEFWSMYKLLVPGNVYSSGHEQIDPGSFVVNNQGFGSHHIYPYNKNGSNRVYLLKGDGLSHTISVAGVNFFCNTDILDMEVLHNGLLISEDIGATGCPVLSISTQAGSDYIIIIYLSVAAPISNLNSVFNYSVSIN